MSAENPKGPNLIPPWIREEAPSEEECRAAAEPVLERGYPRTTVAGEDGFDDVYGEALPVGEYRLSSRPGVVGGGQ